MKALARTLIFVPLIMGLISSPAMALLRLEHEVRPVFQSIALTLDPRQDTYTGSTRMELEATQRVSSFSLHAEMLDLQSVVVSRAGSTVDSRYRMLDSATLSVELTPALEAGPLVLEISFANNYDRRAQGLFKVEVEGESYSFTQFEDDDAREAFPCFDEPGFKFPYQFVLSVPDRDLALANTPIDSATVKDGWRTVWFKRSPPMPSYLLALATGPLDTVALPGLSVPARVVTTRGKGNLTPLALELAPPILSALEEYFGRPYPFEKLDLIAVPEFWPGAMENPGAITFAEDALLIDPAHTSIGDKRRLSIYLAHELSHMWFGDLVTMAWWDDLWLNESFAEWLGSKITQQLYPELGLDISNAQSVGRIMSSDARPSSAAIRQPINNTSDLTGNIGVIYAKGEAVLGMFEAWMGPEVFQRGIRSYLKNKEWSNATAADLLGALDLASGSDVGTALATFLDQPGIPLVSVTPESSGRIVIRQKRFANFGVAVAAGQPWHLPLTLRYADHSKVHEQTILLTEPEMTVDLGTDGPPLWVMPNSEARGYCRWTVPYDMMLTLAKSADTTLSPRERVGFVSNLSALLDAGLLAGDEYLELVAGFRNDPHPQVISAVVGALSNVERAFVTDSLKPLFAPYVRYTLGPALARYGIEKRAGEDEIVSSLRPRLLGLMADLGDDSSLVAFARTVFDTYLKGGSPADPELVTLSVELACRSGDQALFDLCKQRFEQSRTPSERDDYLTALGSFRDPAIQEEALAYALSGPLRPQELFDIPMGVASNSEAHTQQIFQWLLDQYDVIAPKLPPTTRGFLPMMAGGCSLARLERAEEFFSEPAHTFPGVEARLARISDSVRDCVGLREREGAKVAAYLAGVSAAGAVGSGAGGSQPGR